MTNFGEISPSYDKGDSKENRDLQSEVPNEKQGESSETTGLGYLANTIRTYNENVEKFAEARDKKRLDIEMDAFSEMVPSGGKVLDAGCGYGGDSELLESRGYNVTGADLSSGMIKEAKKRFPEIDFMVMDVRHLSFTPNSFDGVWARAVLLHLTPEDIGKSLTEFLRVIKPGGILFIYMKEGEGSEVKEEKFTAEGERFFTYVKEDQLKSMLEKAGFSVEKIYVHNERQVFGESFRDLNWVCAFAKKGVT